MGIIHLHTPYIGCLGGEEQMIVDYFRYPSFLWWFSYVITYVISGTAALLVMATIFARWRMGKDTSPSYLKKLMNLLVSNDYKKYCRYFISNNGGEMSGSCKNLSNHIKLVVINEMKQDRQDCRSIRMWKD